MRIVVLGNCQVQGLAQGLSSLLPQACVEQARFDGPRRAVALRQIEGCDLVVSHFLGAQHGRLGTEALATAGHRLICVPRVVFRGYHPDMAYLGLGTAQVGSPAGAYHSSIIASAFSLGVAAADVPMLFNRLVYARLGHLDAFGKARRLLMADLAACGPDFAALFDAWHAEGPFMHTMNHPRAFVLADIARAAAIGAGLVPADAPRVAPAVDHLAADTIWPVYPELAEPLGLPGGMQFKPPRTQAPLSLRDFIRRSFRRYAAVPPDTFRSGPMGEARAALAAFLGCDPS